jgi:dephospho-CoA kinase
MLSNCHDEPVIVLTGGIASGKSTVAKMLADLGATVISADQIAREIVARGKPTLQKIEAAFGSSVLTPEGDLNRQCLAQIVFNDTKARRKLEELMHPQIWEELNRKITEALLKTPFVVAEIPLYFESGRNIPGSEIWVVYVDKKTQLVRLMSRDSLSLKEAQARLNAQMLLTDKRARADRVIDNSGSKEDTQAQVRRAVEGIKFSTTKNEGT